MIRHLTGSDLGVPRIPEALVVEWAEGSHRVVFSYAKQGDGITAHFAAGKESLREVKSAIDDFVEWIFWAYEWCRMIFAVVAVSSVKRVVKKCGFSWVADSGPYQVYARMKS